MNAKMPVVDEELKTPGHQGLVVLVHLDPGIYYYTVDCRADTDDTTAEVVLNDTLEKYPNAWEKLAEM